MMTFSEAKTQIYAAVASKVFDEDDENINKINQLVTCCILYEFLSSMISSDESIESTLMTTAASYADQYISITKNFQKKYVAYSLMRVVIRSWGYPAFINITESQAKQIITYYHDKTEIVDFSSSSYSQYMYNIGSLTKSQNDRMRKIHFAIMVPIVKYFLDQNQDLSVSDVAIYSIDSVSTNPGKEIIFRIEGVSTAKLIYAIKNKIGIWSYLHSVSQYLEYVKITVK